MTPGARPSPGGGSGSASPSGRATVRTAAIAVGFAAADTYVVVLALPDMMAGVGLGTDQLQRAAPIVSGFLLGYVAVLPLIGRISDLVGRRPVLVASLLVFAFGSTVTASAYDLGWLVAGRLLQGLGAGGLVPVTLALVADTYPATGRDRSGRRGVVLGLVGAVQELGSVVGPLFGAVVLAVWTWRGIFWINLVVGVALAIVLRGRPRTDRSTGARRAGLVGAAAVLGTALGALTLAAPPALTTGVTLGLPFVPITGSSRLFTPIGLAAVLLLAGAALAWTIGHRRTIGSVVSRLDPVGTGLLCLALGAVVLAFATADPERAVLPPAGPALLATAVVALVVGAVWRRRASHPAIPRGMLRPPPAWGALVVSLLTGAALVAALVDVPVFARLTAYPGSQLGAALVLVRFLVAVPPGAVLGGLLARRTGDGPAAAIGLVLAAVGFAAMARWGAEALIGVGNIASTVALVVAGLGFGLAVAPVNNALLGATDANRHGVAGALVVAARMIGMLVGVSALTAIGLRRYYAVAASVGSPAALCPGADPVTCRPYTGGLVRAGLAQVHAIFWSAGVLALVAAALALVLLSRRTRRIAAAVP